VTLVAPTGIPVLTFDVPFMFSKSVMLCAPAGTQIRCSATSATVVSALVDTQVCGTVNLCLSITSVAPVVVSLPVLGYCRPNPCRAPGGCSPGSAQPAPPIPEAAEVCVETTRVFDQCFQTESLSFCFPVP
jgi:hypothetical protein